MQRKPSRKWRNVAEDYWRGVGEYEWNIYVLILTEEGIFLDDESYDYEANQNNLDIPLVWRQRVASLNTFVAPNDIYLLDD